MSKKLSIEEFIKRAKEIHGDKYDYSKVKYKSWNEKVCIVCHEKGEDGEEHGEFWMTPGNHIGNKQICPKCSSSAKWTTAKFIQKAKEIHGNKYDYSKVDYQGVYTKVTIGCPIHGYFQITPKSHVYFRHGCNQCGNIEAGLKHRVTIKEFIERGKKIHNYRYDYSEIKELNTLEDYVTIICPKGHKFQQKAMYHLDGAGCPYCKQSKLELSIEDLLKFNKINYIPQYPLDELKTERGQQTLDFYLPQYNLAIECQGEQHFIPVDFGGKGEEWALNFLKENIERDKRKLKICSKKGIPILYFAKQTYGKDNIITDKNILLKKIREYGNNGRDEHIVC